MTTITKIVTDEDLDRYTRAVKAACDANFDRNGWTYEEMRQVITIEPGRKYARIVQTDMNGSGRSVHSFINLQNGDILKAESWKKPAKHSRGNIYQDGWEGSFGPYGANYL